MYTIEYIRFVNKYERKKFKWVLPLSGFYVFCLYSGAVLQCPEKVSVAFLLLCSIAYYLLTDNGILILYPLASVAVCYGGIRVLAGTEDVKRRKFALAAVVTVNIGILFLLKYINFVVYTVNGIAGLSGRQGMLLQGLNLLVPLGVSFYTFSLLGYVIDVYYGIAAPQRNFGKVALYGMYFPAMISGPILQYRECGEQFLAAFL